VSGRRKRSRPAGRAVSGRDRTAPVSPRRRGSVGLAVAGVAVVAIVLAALWMAHASGPTPAAPPPAAPVAVPAVSGPQPLRIDVLAVHPHDPQAYTQGLVWHRGELYESDGLYGKSSLRRVDPATGTVRQQIAIEPRIFAEGLALVGERLIQLTWREGLAPVYDRATFRHLADFHYEGEGWGLCYDGKRLVMSDGSDRLFFRDPQTFALQGSVAVTREGVPVTQLNELECVDGEVWSNVWQTDDILRIDPRSGRVTGVAEATGLLTPEDRAGGAEVLNGIAYDPATRRFWITGKLWPKMFEVRFAPAGR
jgi:glutaminyl-peptide cyclotransferase